MMLLLAHVCLMMNMSSMLMAHLRTSWEVKLGLKHGRRAFQLKAVAHLSLRTTDLTDVATDAATDAATDVATDAILLTCFSPVLGRR